MDKHMRLAAVGALLVGIGDDAAIVAGPSRLAVTTDVLLEDHELVAQHPQVDGRAS